MYYVHSIHTHSSLNYVVRTGIAQSVQRLAKYWTVDKPGYDSPRGHEIISILHSVQTGFQAYTLSHPVGTGTIFPWG
jgi:hypothetical protein